MDDKKKEKIRNHIVFAVSTALTVFSLFSIFSFFDNLYEEGFMKLLFRIGYGINALLFMGSWVYHSLKKLGHLSHERKRVEKLETDFTKYNSVKNSVYFNSKVSDADKVDIFQAIFDHLISKDLLPENFISFITSTSLDLRKCYKFSVKYEKNKPEKFDTIQIIKCETITIAREQPKNLKFANKNFLVIVRFGECIEYSINDSNTYPIDIIMLNLENTKEYADLMEEFQGFAT